MSDRGWMEPIVERVVGQVLESHAAQLKSEIVRRVMEEVAAQAAPPVASAASGSTELAHAVIQVRAGTSQKEILRALLDSSACCAARVALFVVKGSQATGWQSRGLQNGETFKDFAIDAGAPAVQHTLSDRVAAGAAGTQFDPSFHQQFGNPAGEARLFPLILKDKVAALVYADGGTDGGLFDAGSLEVLVFATSTWLEVNSLRKQAAQKEPGTAAGEDYTPPARESAAAPPYNDPFAGHAPAYAMAAAASGSPSEVAAAQSPGQRVGTNLAFEAQSAAVEVQSASSAAIASDTVAEPLPVMHAHAEVHAPRVEPAPVASSASPEDQEIQRKAQRFARLLVDEIKLYNQAKVSEGRKSKNLYDRLKEAIEKSRATYQKRYGNTVAAAGNYFQHELIRSLAEDDASLMGQNFHL
jgi:hypothetical protein